MPENFANFYTTTTTEALTASATSVGVLSVTGIPSVPFRAILQDADNDPTNREVVVVSGVSGTTLTIVRAADGTTGLSHASGSFIANVATAVSLNAISNPTAQMVAVPASIPGAAVASLTPAASTAFMAPVNIGARMQLISLKFDVATSGAGSVQWGLFHWKQWDDMSPLSAVKIAGGTGALGGTGIRQITASSSGVTVPPGPYALIFLMPASGVPTLKNAAIGAVGSSAGVWRTASSYTWSDTPDLTAFGWTTAQIVCFLHGHVGRSGFSVDW